MMKFMAIILVVMLCFSVATMAQAKALSNNEKAAAGLKEALQVGSANAVAKTGKTDGYFGNPIIKILMPEKLKRAEKVMRKVGLGKTVDEFILSMNRAAEKASPSAKQIFWDAIKAITFKDALGILRGGDTAATVYFKEKTSPQLTTAFLPVVKQATAEVGVTQKYKTLAAKAKKIPLVKMEPVDLDQYIVAKALDGLFYMLGEEEKKIRKDPVARVTQLLKEVFGN